MLIARCAQALGMAAWLAGVISAPGPAQASDSELGRRLFHGDAALTGHISGHAAPLPTAASRCVNCHAVGTAPPSASAGNSTQSFGPVLNREVLGQERKRRGGPPSRYDEAAFCKLLATGVDPAYIIIPSNMPRYQLSAGDCKALWAYLIQR